ncbi:MAG: MmgE/PrpD family protein, partial [Terriglobales bacterium]
MDLRKDIDIKLLQKKLTRRGLAKLGTNMIFSGLTAAKLAAQSPPEVVRPEGVHIQTGPGWKNTADRAFGNGPMDETSKKIVRYVSGLSRNDLSPSCIHALNRTMLDTMACLISGFESDSARICARLARSTRHQLKCTVLGYDLTTSPEMAAFANGSMIRFADFNDLGPGGHNSDIISALLAVGEALH